jgi:ferredoxin-NADP reductase/MOSC domain-containing protein YiiM/ferredoxin
VIARQPVSVLVSVNVGLPRDVEWQGRVVHTAIWKRPVVGRVMARRLDLDGDGQGDLVGHGGEQRAVMIYQLASYRHWETHLHRQDLEYGQFGENLTVEGLPDDEVCIGDRYRIGTALFEVTQPRVTCYRVGIRMNEPQMPALLVSHRRPGFYCRVIEEGDIGAGDEIVKVAAGPEHVTVAEIDALLYLPAPRRDRLEHAARIPALSIGWKKSLEALLAAAAAGNRSGNAGLTPVGPPPAWQGYRRLRVAEVRRESEDVWSFVLESEDHAALPAPLPGQFVALRLCPGQGGAPTVRSYSLSGPPAVGTYRISVKRTEGIGSRYLIDSTRVADTLEVSAPRGTFTLAAGILPIVLLSAGIGVTPVLAMLHALASDPASSQREVWWLHGARNGSEHPFAAEARDLLRGLPRSRSFVAYSRPGPGDRVGADYDMAGRLGLASLQRLGVPRLAEFYLCGPPAFLAGLTAELTSWGVAETSIHKEIFGPGERSTPGIPSSASKAPHPPAGASGTGPRVSFGRTGLTVPWDGRFQSLLELAEACDVPVRWSCRTGVCHTCECGLVDGSLRYAPEPLDRPAVGNALICCSTPLSEVDLDL